MKMINEKISKSDVCIWLIIALLAIYIHLRSNFLITFSNLWIALSYCGIILIIMSLIYLYKKNVKYIKVIKLSTIVFLSAWNILYLYGYSSVSKHQIINVTVPLKGYYTRRIDGVLFSYRGYKFDRTINLTDVLSKYGDDLPNKCELELSLEQIFPNFYYIKFIDIVEKKSKDKSEFEIPR